MRSASALIILAFLGACGSTPPIYVAPSAPPPPAPTATTPPPQRPTTPQAAPSTPSFIAPEVMNVPGLESVIGRSAAALVQSFGKARLDVKEGDARKLQFIGNACVLDIYLYPLSPGATPSATHVEARRASDGQNVDRVACLRSIEKN